MRRIQEFIGKEHESDAVNRALRTFAQAQRPSAVGAVHVTCSDETERETAETFQRWFADALLPELKFWSKAPFRAANLGNRYEWGAIRIAEPHFATAESREGFKLLLVKINAHVAVDQDGGRTTYGCLDRYNSKSPCCGALDALLNDYPSPATDELETMFQFDGLPRLDMLRDESSVDLQYRSFLAAIVNARLQARSAIVDIQDYTPDSPTLTVVIPSVAMNRRQRDSEFVVGMYWADSRGRQGEAEYVGLGDDPSRYEIISRHGYLRVTDGPTLEEREARDHRQEVGRHWQLQREPLQLTGERLRALRMGPSSESARAPNMTYETLKTVLSVAADIAPIPLSIMLFARGLAGIHHLYRVHQLARGLADQGEALRIIEEVSDHAKKIPETKVRETIDALLALDQVKADGVRSNKV